MVADSVRAKWLAEFDSSKVKAVMTTTANQAAGAAFKQNRSKHRVGGGGRGGATPSQHTPGPPPTFDHESSLRDRTPQQQEWLDIETDRVVRSGAWGDWCFSFDLKDVYHAVEIDPEFQKFIQFDIQGTVAYDVTRTSQVGARVLPYMDDFLVIAQTRDDAFVQRDRVEKHLSRLGLFRNEKKGHWEPTQLAKHLGLEVDFKEGLFRVTEARLKKIHAKATGLICRAARDQRWVQARELAGFNGLYQSVFLATDIKKYGETTIKYDDRDVEELVLEEERYRVPRSVTTEGQQQEVRPTPWRAALLQHWTGELGDNKYSDTAAAMQASALQRLTADNYGRHWEKFMKFCGEHGLQWLPASATTVQLYVASLLESGTTEAAEQQDITETTADRHGDAERESLLRDSKGLSIVLEKEKGKNHLLCIPKEGVAEPHELLDQWEQARDDE
ncbi:hypothetical protein CYMTET_47877 [Cymbomonas tetramitiformis]|uniref:Reverse transcriptase domain-containing protein n=1 Tax=Cymbomonas tetramitiformis TaxID=36881 RepID=A0AAE0EVP9_9CHLO|nr:hypothetical protein CYMTET_47877 [Cymbomonas tetramitiformis]